MDDLIKENTLLCVKLQAEPGSPEALAEDGCIQTTADGPTVNITADDLERSLSSGDPFQYDFEKSMRNGDWSIPVEYKAGSEEGSMPEYAPFLQSLGFAIESYDGTVSTVAGLTSTTVLEVPAAELSRFKKNRIIALKKVGQAGAFHVSPIASINEGDSEITLLIPMSEAPSALDSFEIAAVSNCALSKSENKILTISKIFDGGKRVHQLDSGRCGTLALQTWSAGQLSSLLFGGTALDGSKSILGVAVEFEPVYDSSKPPVIRESCLWVNGVKKTVTEVGWNIERPITEKKSTCAKNNKVKSRHSGKLKVSGTFNPYLEDDEIEFDLDGSEFSIFSWAGRPTAEGEFNQIVAYFIPRAKANSAEDGEIEGLMSETVSWTAVGSGADDTIKLAFI